MRGALAFPAGFARVPRLHLPWVTHACRVSHVGYQAGGFPGRVGSTWGSHPVRGTCPLPAGPTLC